MRGRFLLLGLFALLGLVGVLGAVSGSSAAPPASYVYWTNQGANAIGRANLDGTNVNQSFISGASGAFGLAVDAGHVYWTNFAGGTIGRANLDGTNANQSFVIGDNPIGVAVSPPPPLSLHAGTTICNGASGGTGTRVVVPTGATCTLIPGTHVRQNVTVRSGGTLYATGVTIGRSLFDYGRATVCQSRVRLDVKAFSASGSLELGGPNCQRGNKISNDVSVSHASNTVWIQGNTIANHLIVENSHGAANSIVGNTVGNLLVRDSGPVFIQGNHANKGTLNCIHNNPQTGSGNTALGKNTCPK